MASIAIRISKEPRLDRSSCAAWCDSLARCFDDLLAPVRAAGRARAVAQARLAALRARDERGRCESVVRAALVALAHGGTSLRNGHLNTPRIAVGREAPGLRRPPDAQPAQDRE